MSTLNWSDLIKDAGETNNNYEPLPDGDYELVVVEGVAKVTQSGKTMFSVKTQVEAGPHAKRLVWDNLVVSPDNPTALGIFFRKMSAMGLGKEFFDSNPTNAQIEQALAGRKFRGQIGSRTYNGQKRNEIKNYYPVQTAATPQTAAAPAASPSPAAAPPPPAAPAPTTAESAPSAAPAAPF